MILTYARLVLGYLLLFDVVPPKSIIETASCEVQIVAYDLLSAIKNDITPIKEVLVKAKANDVNKWNNKGVTDSKGELTFKLAFDEEGELLHRFMAQRSGYETTTKLVFVGQHINSVLNIQYFLLKDEDKKELASMIRADISGGMFEEALDKIRIFEDAYPEMDSIKFIDIIQLKEEIQAIQLPEAPSIYVWEFATRDGQRNEMTDAITAQVEDALVNSNCCSVLQRRMYSRPFDQKENAVALKRIDEISSFKLKALESLEATAILFGEVSEHYLTSKQVKIEISLVSLNGMVIRSERTFLPMSDLANPLEVRKAIAELIESLNLNPKSNTSANVKTEKSLFALSGCNRSGNKVTCRFTVNSFSRDRKLVLYASQKPSSYAYNNFGYVHQANSVRLAGGESQQALERTLISDVPVEGAIIFSDIPLSVTHFNFLEIGVQVEALGIEKVRFRNIPIVQ